MTHHNVFTQEQIDEINRLKLDTSDAGRETYQNYVLSILENFHKPDTTPIPPPPNPTLPADGRLQPEKGANKDATLWKAVVMRDDASKFKVIDDKDINVADLFNSQATAQQFIDYYRWKQSQTPEPIPTPGPTPEPTPGPVEGDVKMIYPGTGAKTDFYYKSSNAGRSQWKSDIPKCWLNQEVTAYLKVAKVSNMGEEVSIKLRGGNHGSPASEGSCFIIGIGYNGSVNCQYEKPHPKNHSLSSTVITPNPLGNNIVGKSFGIKGIVYQEGDHDKIECWIDKGGLTADGKPANQWIKFWETTSKVFFGKCNGGGGGEKAYLRMDDVSGDPKSAVDVKYASVREIKPAV